MRLESYRQSATSEAYVKIEADGKVSVYSNAVEMGQGCHEVFRAIVCEELGLIPDDVIVALPDTDIAPFDEGTTSSRTTFHAGNAMRLAAQDLKTQLMSIAARHWAVETRYIEVSNKFIILKTQGCKMSFADAVAICKESCLTGKGSYCSSYCQPLDPETGQSKKPTAFWMFSAQAAEVEVDLDTGKVKVLKIASANDIGTALNVLGCEQQVEGGVIMGIGQALYEQLLFAEGGVQNPTFHDYKIPTSFEIPEIKTILIETAPHEKGPYGAKGLGEGTTIPTAAAIAGAVYDAVGAEFISLPMVAEKVFWKLKECGMNSI